MSEDADDFALDDAGDFPEQAVLMVRDRFGVEGLRALAAFMHAMGSDGTLRWTPPDDPEGAWCPCDVVMQHADALVGEAGVDADAPGGGATWVMP